MDPGVILEKDFVIQTSSVRSAIGFVCKYCGSGRLRRSDAIKHAASAKHQAKVSGLGQGRWAAALAKYTFLDSTDERGVDSTELGTGQGMWEQDTYQTPSFDPEPYAASEEDTDNKHEGSEIELDNSNPFDGDAGLANVQPGSDELPGDAFEPSRVETWSPPRYRPGARNSSAVPPPDHPFYPFPDPLMIIIVLFVRSPKRRVGVQELEDLLDFAAATGTTGLPAASTVRTFLGKLETEVPLFRPIEMKKDKDRSVYVVSPGDYIASMSSSRLERVQPVVLTLYHGVHPPTQHFARPSTARAMEHYPVLQPAHVDSAHHTRRWLSDLPPPFSAPMTRVRGVFSFVDYFVDEIVTLKGSTQYGFVERFVSFKGEVHAIMCSATVAPGSRIDVVVPAAGRGIKPWPHFNPASWCLAPVTALGQPVHDLGTKGPPARINIRSSDAVDIERSLPLFSIDRTLARGRLLLVTPLRTFLDDLAATESKRWNPMYAASVQNMALPSSMIKRRPMLHHTGATDTTVDALDLADSVLGLISETLRDRPLECYHALLGERVLVRLPVLCSIHDSPMAAACSARARGGLFPCIHCLWGGSAKERLTEAQLLAFFECPLEHEAATTQTQSLEQIKKYACTMTMQSFNKMRTSSGTHDPWTKRAVAQMFARYKKEMTHLSHGVKPEPGKVKAFKRMSDSAQTSTRNANRERARIEVDKLKDEIIQKGNYIGPFFRVPEFDPHSHMPLDILHVFLLGIVKYAWKATLSVKALDKDTPGRARLAATLASLSSVGFRRNIADVHFVKFANTLVGYDFVVLCQIMPLVSHFLFQAKLVPPALNECWSAIGKLGHHLHPLEVSDLDRYAVSIIRRTHTDLRLRETDRSSETECESLVGNLLQSSMRRDLSHVLAKPKYHALAGLGRAIRMFGPPRSFDASLAESANKILRQHSIRTNHHRVSRDIARKIGDTERISFIVRGGTWERDGKRVGIGHAAKEYIDKRPEMQKWLPEGADITAECAKSVRYIYAASSPVLSSGVGLASSTCFSIAPGDFDQFPPTGHWRKAKLAVLPNGDNVHPHDWCLFKKQAEDKVLVGQIVELLAHVHKSVGGDGLVAIRPARVGSELAATGFLALAPTEDLVVVTIEEVMALAVVQHDCSRSKCEPTTDADGGVAVHHATDGRMLMSTIAQRSFNELAAFRPSIKVPSPTPAFVTSILASRTLNDLLKKTATKSKTSKGNTLAEEVDTDDEDEGGPKQKKRKHAPAASVRNKRKGKAAARTTTLMATVDEETESDLTDERELSSSASEASSSSAFFTDDCVSSTDNDNTDSDADMASPSPARTVDRLTDACVGTGYPVFGYGFICRCDPIRQRLRRDGGDRRVWVTDGSLPGRTSGAHRRRRLAEDGRCRNCQHSMHYEHESLVPLRTPTSLTSPPLRSRGRSRHHTQDCKTTGIRWRTCARHVMRRDLPPRTARQGRVCPLPLLPPLHRCSEMEQLFLDPSSDSEQDPRQPARSTWCIATNKTVAEVLAIELPEADASLGISITKDVPVVLSEGAAPPRPTVSSRREFRQVNLLHGAVADGYRSLAVGDHRLPLDYERVWAELDVVERIQARFRRSLAWLAKLEGNAREVLTDALRTAVWDAREAPEEGPSLESVVSLLSDDWLGEFVVNYAIADIVQLASSNSGPSSRRYGLIPSDCLVMAIHPSASGTTLDKYCLDAWLVRISGWPCATLGALRRYIIKHPETIWFLPICDHSHWFLARLDVANNNWQLLNSMASRALDERVLTALGDLFRLLGLKLDANKPITPSTPQQRDNSSCGPAIINIVEKELLGEAAFDPARPKISRVRQFQRLLRDFPRRTQNAPTVQKKITANKVTAPTGVADDGLVEDEPLPSEMGRPPAKPRAGASRSVATPQLRDLPPTAA